VKLTLAAGGLAAADDQAGGGVIGKPLAPSARAKTRAWRREETRRGVLMVHLQPGASAEPSGRTMREQEQQSRNVIA
jgi:hypothetical protein